MRQRPAILQYALLTLIAAISLAHAWGGARLTSDNFFHGMTTARMPFSSGYLQQSITGTNAEARVIVLRAKNQHGQPPAAIPPLFAAYHF